MKNGLNSKLSKTQNGKLGIYRQAISEERFEMEVG